MKTLSKIILINEEKSKVWNFLTNPENFIHYVSGHQRGEVIPHSSEGIGSSYHWEGQYFGVCLKIKEEVIEWNPPKRVSYRGSTCGVHFVSKMELEEKQNGLTQLLIEISYGTPTCFLGPIASNFLINPILRSHIQKSSKKIQNYFAGL